MISVNNVKEVSPPITLIANPFEINVPDAFVSASGMRTVTVAKAVIKVVYFEKKFFTLASRLCMLNKATVAIVVTIMIVSVIVCSTRCCKSGGT
jgi:hypothetical protein